MAPFHWKLTIALLLLFFIFTPSGHSQAATAPTSSAQAAAFASSAIAALTGGGQINDVVLTGTVTRTVGPDNDTGTVTLSALGTGNSRLDLNTTAGTLSEIRTNAAGFPQGTWIGPDGTSHAMLGHNCLTDAVWFFPAFSVLSQATTTNVVVTYVGQETRNGASVQHLQFAQPPSITGDSTGFLTTLSTEDVYLDAVSFLPVAILFYTHPDNNAGSNISVEIDFSNYQLSGTASVPGRIQELINDSVLLDITVQSVTLNSGLMPSVFAQ